MYLHHMYAYFLLLYVVEVFLELLHIFSFHYELQIQADMVFSILIYVIT